MLVSSMVIFLPSSRERLATLKALGTRRPDTEDAEITVSSSHQKQTAEIRGSQL